MNIAERKAYDEWLESLKPGDAVILKSGYGFHNRDCVAKVARVTPTLIVLEGNRRFRRKDGRQYESPPRWGSSDSLEKPTKEARRRVRLENARDTLRNLKPEQLNDAQVLAMVRAMNDHADKAGEGGAV
ncbi:hypothetical protein [Pseudomonas phage Itty13]|jgi:hypothetical protein|uniref:Uncharacterized protein n=1 Tax=Pseudomonas phage Itty13 TaxID=2805750 RepID=A0A889IR49_9CAUD|nr:hypothetical protein PQC19_gp73 [Pseudomonas phage Itty13]QRE00649.1 hypothetical protein [Pseudomonas phage Itty13]